MPRPLYIRVLGTLATFFQFGGPTASQIKLSAGNLECRNAADNAFIKLSGDDAVNDDNFVTKRQLPVVPPPGQTIESHVVEDVTIGAPDFFDLVVIDIACAADCNLLLTASFSCTNTTAGSYFVLDLDGVRVDDSGSGNNAATFHAGAIVREVPVTAGPHQVKLQCRTDDGTKTFIYPVARPDSEHATLLVQEILA